MKEFIAATDDYLYESADIFNHLVPYQVGRPCRRLAVDPLEITPADLQVGDFLESNADCKGDTP